MDKEIAVLGKNLYTLRLKNGLTQKEMAKLLKIGVRSLSLLENGVLPPRMTCNIFFCLYEHFGILPEECFEEKE